MLTTILQVVPLPSGSEVRDWIAAIATLLGLISPAVAYIVARRATRIDLIQRMNAALDGMESRLEQMRLEQDASNQALTDIALYSRRLIPLLDGNEPAQEIVQKISETASGHRISRAQRIKDAGRGHTKGITLPLKVEGDTT